MSNVEISLPANRIDKQTQLQGSTRRCNCNYSLCRRWGPANFLVNLCSLRALRANLTPTPLCETLFHVPSWHPRAIIEFDLNSLVLSPFSSRSLANKQSHTALPECVGAPVRPRHRPSLPSRRRRLAAAANNVCAPLP